MRELKAKITQALKNIQLTNLATIVADGVPWARYVMIAGKDDLIIRCATFLSVRKVDQIKPYGIEQWNPASMDPEVLELSWILNGRNTGFSMG